MCAYLGALGPMVLCHMDVVTSGSIACTLAFGPQQNSFLPTSIGARFGGHELIRYGQGDV